TGQARITKLRGTPVESNLIPGLKVIPTFHPAAVLRNWEYRPIVVADLIKARRESDFPEIRRPRRLIYIPDSIGDLHYWEDTFIQAYPNQCQLLSVDVETARRQITCVGFATVDNAALVVPIWD